VDSIWIKGGKRLEGKIPISGAKNSALALLPCALLTDEPLTLANLPRLADVDSFGHLLNQLGVSTSVAGVRIGEFGRKMTLKADAIESTVAPYDMVRKMRASVLVLGPMLARAGEATVSLPGGCAIGDRPIDLHLKALEAIGARDRACQRLCESDRSKGPSGRRRIQLPGSLGRSDRKCGHGRGSGKRPHRAVQRRPRARDRRSVQSSGSDGRDRSRGSARRIWWSTG
jgi:UDP-N-acetylglucosamine enolpyruvyl transferase